MKIYVTLLFLIFHFVAHSQNGDPNIIEISVSCGFGGSTSSEILALQNLNSSTNYEAIKSKLIEGTDIEVVLSTIILREHYRNNVLELTRAELSKIKQLKKSLKKFSFCYTCTYHKKGTIRQLFSNRKNEFLYEILKQRLLNSN